MKPCDHEMLLEFSIVPPPSVILLFVTFAESMHLVANQIRRNSKSLMEFEVFSSEEMKKLCPCQNVDTLVLPLTL